jgi:hypothetical protein
MSWKDADGAWVHQVTPLRAEQLPSFFVTKQRSGALIDFDRLSRGTPGAFNN